MKISASAIVLFLITSLIIPSQIIYAEDNQIPTVSITSPSEGINVSGTVPILGLADDTDGNITRVDIKINEEGLWSMAVGTTSWSYTWNTTTYENGVHTIYARSYDGKNYSENKSVQVLINNIHIPIDFNVDGTLGNNGWYISNVSVEIQADISAQQLDYINYSVDGTWMQSTSGTFDVELSSGIHHVKAYAVNTGGQHGGVVTTSLKVDTEMPTIDVILNPTTPNGNDQWFIDEVEVFLVLDGTISPAVGIDYQIDDRGWIEYLGTFLFSIEGQHILYFRAEDAAGHITIINISLKVDVTDPAITIIAPNGTLIKELFDIKWNATDTVDGSLDGNISLFYLYNNSDDGINGWVQTDIATGINNTGTFSWNTFTAVDSLQGKIKIVAVDDAGNVGEIISDVFILDNTPPAITITQPLGGEIYGPNITIEIEWEANDDIDDSLDGNVSIEYYDGESWTILGENLVNSGRYTLNPADWENGNYKIRITAVDDAGNIGIAVSDNFTIDKQPPQVSFSRPEEGAIYFNLFGRDLLPPIPIPLASLSQIDVIIVGPITVEINAADVHSDIELVEIQVDGNFNPIYNQPFDWEWDPSLGMHTIEATAYDNAGNSKTVTIENVLCINI